MTNRRTFLKSVGALLAGLVGAKALPAKDLHQELGLPKTLWGKPIVIEDDYWINKYPPYPGGTVHGLRAGEDLTIGDVVYFDRDGRAFKSPRHRLQVSPEATCLKTVSKGEATQLLMR